MRKLPLVLLSIISSFIFFHTLQAIDSKGAIIIANLEGQVTVKNNDTGVPLSADRVKVGGMIFDGHTVETGKGSKVVLLFSSGTITTLKEESVLNIKKFAQQKFDPKSDKWLRINMYQGAPLIHELNSSDDTWMYDLI